MRSWSKFRLMQGVSRLLARKRKSFRARAHVRESCVRGYRFCQPRDIPITLTPFDAKFLPDGAVDLHLGFPCTEQSCYITAPLVSLLACAFDVGFVLAEANHRLFFRDIHKVSNFDKIIPIARRPDTASFYHLCQHPHNAERT